MCTDFTMDMFYHIIYSSTLPLAREREGEEGGECVCACVACWPFVMSHSVKDWIFSWTLPAIGHHHCSYLSRKYGDVWFLDFSNGVQQSFIWLGLTFQERTGRIQERISLCLHPPLYLFLLTPVPHPFPLSLSLSLLPPQTTFAFQSKHLYAAWL